MSGAAVLLVEILRLCSWARNTASGRLGAQKRLPAGGGELSPHLHDVAHVGGGEVVACAGGSGHHSHAFANGVTMAEPHYYAWGNPAAPDSISAPGWLPALRACTA